MALPILDGNQTAATLSTIITGGAHIPAHTVVSLGSQAISDISNAVSSLQVSGTVTANVLDISSEIGISGQPNNGVQIGWYDNATLGYKAVTDVDPFPVSVGNSITIGSLPAISGTVTVGNFDFSATGQGGQFATKSVQVGFISDPSSDFYVAAGEDYPFPVNIRNSVTIGSLPAISGTVTANNPNGALTTRFGSVVTANESFITSAVTNTNRKYLLAQNISSGTVTIGIGFSPTTTQGIQLTAGGGLTFDAFCPTGAVYWLGAVTGAAFTILEG